MADSDLPPLFDTVDINSPTGVDDDGDNIFSSTIENCFNGTSNNQNLEDGKNKSPLFEPDQSVYESATFEKVENTQEKLTSVLQSSQTLEEVDTETYDQFLEISVTDPQKIGDGMGSYIAYKVITKTNMPKFRKSQFSVIRRFSDFLGKKNQRKKVKLTKELC